MGTAAFLMAQSYLLHDARFVIPSSASIVFEGNSHVTRAQLLGIFGEDVDRNIFTVSLDERRAQLERLPWVAHATVMRLLPNRMRVSIVERTPVAFVRQGSRIGLVDGNGVLLDMPVGSEKREHYSFPVVTGISANEPLSTRAARMKIFERFTSELDGAGDKAAGEKISEQLSEVDLSNPEDAQALIPDHSTEILVHFGEDNFLERYQRFKEHLPEWKTLYPKLSAVDMRYERQVVLQMPPGSGASATTSSNAGASVVTSDTSATGTTADPVEGTEVTPSVKPQAKPAAKSAVKTPTARRRRTSIPRRRSGLWRRSITR
jgi:cell division protein FtsQ